MRLPGTPRAWIWAAVAAQLLGLGFDAAWHAWPPDFEAVTVEQMVTHLGTVHVPLYAGVMSVLLATAWALVDRVRRSRPVGTLPVALAGALLSTAGEAWHARTHLQLSTHSGPIAAATSFLGLIVVVVAQWRGRSRGRERDAEAAHHRRAA